jgi:hypothetical protein
VLDEERPPDEGDPEEREHHREARHHLLAAVRVREAALDEHDVLRRLQDRHGQQRGQDEDDDRTRIAEEQPRVLAEDHEGARQAHGRL